MEGLGSTQFDRDRSDDIRVGGELAYFAASDAAAEIESALASGTHPDIGATAEVLQSHLLFVCRVRQLQELLDPASDDLSNVEVRVMTVCAMLPLIFPASPDLTLKWSNVVDEDQSMDQFHDQMELGGLSELLEEYARWLFGKGGQSVGGPLRLGAKLSPSTAMAGLRLAAEIIEPVHMSDDLSA